jgi:DNA-directed RNA polymerase subunit N (RpoN/RPB10)
MNIITLVYTNKMIIPVKCMTCGKVLADKYEYYKKEVEKRKRERGIDGIQYFNAVDEAKITPEGEVMNELGFTRMCCRRHLLAHVDIV